MSGGAEAGTPITFGNIDVRWSEDVTVAEYRISLDGHHLVARLDGGG